MLNLYKKVSFFGLRNHVLDNLASPLNPSRKFFSSGEVPKFKINISNDYDLAKKQVFWRIRNIGQLELEFLLMKWFEQQTMNIGELKEFAEEVLQMENPEMNKYFVKFDAPSDTLTYVKRIQHDILNNLYK
jgi:succinate dehydrogenase flavin-adding protein (antitoxin of CptAB toxin-antitoxin module)